MATLLSLTHFYQYVFSAFLETTGPSSGQKTTLAEALSFLPASFNVNSAVVSWIPGPIQ